MQSRLGIISSLEADNARTNPSLGLSDHLFRWPKQIFGWLCWFFVGFLFLHFWLYYSILCINNGLVSSTLPHYCRFASSGVRFYGEVLFLLQNYYSLTTLDCWSKNIYFYRFKNNQRWPISGFTWRKILNNQYQ